MVLFMSLLSNSKNDAARSRHLFDSIFIRHTEEVFWTTFYVQLYLMSLQIIPLRAFLVTLPVTVVGSRKEHQKRDERLANSPIVTHNGKEPSYFLLCALNNTVCEHVYFKMCICDSIHSEPHFDLRLYKYKIAMILEVRCL